MFGVTLLHILIDVQSNSITTAFSCLPIPQMTQSPQDWFIATCSTQLSSGFAWWNAFFVSTQWWTNYCFHSNQIGAWNWWWSMIQLPRKAKPTHLEIGARKNETSNNLRPIRAFELQGSNDWTNFTTIFSQSWLWNSRSIGSVKSWDFTNNNSYLYFRLRVQANSSYVAFDYWNIQ